ncbi:type I polyketide synthase [Microbispora bryophytorum]|uniref:type I polyketide synthase n=1 Tax=Microbispora bryophytorum TaxID=1460882 RepID=UPI00371934C6
MTRDRSLDIAVTGMSARFPGVSGLTEWWSALTAGRVLTKRYDRQELLDAGLPKSLLDDPDYVPVRGHLADADRFDNEVFQISPREAEMMDPQHRLMLETAWAALEDAGIAPSSVGPVTGVYASASGSGYLHRMLAGGMLDPLTLEDAVHGNEPDFMASHISYRLGLTGPAVAVQTACSSSLVAVHMAVQALLNGDCDQALVVAAGVAFPQAGHLAVPGGVHSPSGRCRPFDAGADGVVAGSGVACVVLRRLADALEDGPEPYAVILGTAINNDGAMKAGYYAPSAEGQEAVIQAALRAADVDASSLGYLETHGTGTRLGDPIEWSAASAALAGTGARLGQVAVGALKANVGHLDNASGLAGLIKATLVVREGVVPPVAGFTRLNPLLETAGSPLYVPVEAGPWTGPSPRRAGVSSFGIGGTNAHVIVEEAPRSAADATGAQKAGGVHEALGAEKAGGVHEAGGGKDAPERARLVVLSAAGPEALSRSTERLREYLTHGHGTHGHGTQGHGAQGHGAQGHGAQGHGAGDGPALADVAFTLAAGRAELPERLAVAGRTPAEIAARLKDGAVRGRRPADGPPACVFLFPGQGTQHPGMAVPFATTLPGFSSGLERCLAAFPPDLAERTRRALLDPAFPAAELEETELAQPALFAVEYAAAAALVALGVTPAAVAGHSLGEITAACLAGVLDLADAAGFVAARGRAMQQCPPGAMLALGCDASRGEDLVRESGLRLDLAADNGPGSCTVAGTAENVAAFQEWLGDRVFSRRLRTSRAFHSALVEPAVPRLSAHLAGTVLRPPAVALAANATGRVIPAGEPIAPDLLVDQARRTVRFAAAMEALAERVPGATAVEVGPGRVLSALAEQAGLSAVPLSPARATHAVEEVLTALGTLWTRGLPISLTALCGGGRRVRLPGYPFAGPRWLAPEAAPAPDAARSAAPAALVQAGTDRKAESGDESRPADAPSETAAPDVYNVLADLWRELLKPSELTGESDFFQLGGDSLAITHLARRAGLRLGVKVPIRDLLAARTLDRQAEAVRDLLTGRPGSEPGKAVS